MRHTHLTHLKLVHTTPVVAGKAPKLRPHELALVRLRAGAKATGVPLDRKAAVMLSEPPLGPAA